MEIWATKPSLPQNDRHQDQRQKELTDLQTKFQYDRTTLLDVPISASVPKEARPGPGWSLKIIEMAYQLRRNWEKLLDEESFQFELELPHKEPYEIAKMLLEKDLINLLGYGDPDLGVATERKRPESFESYLRLFKQFKSPKNAASLYSDSEFADSFVSGINPLMLRAIQQIPEKLAYDEVTFRKNPLFSHDSLSHALSEGRVFLVDYDLLQSLEPGTHPDQNKYVYAPIVLLAVPQQAKNIEVLGIQYGQDRSEFPLVTPQDNPWSWLIGKTIVKISDINYHEVASHLCLTHLVVEPIVVATYRQLPSCHPLQKLLMPHFEGTIPINALAVKRLINQGGKVEQLATSKIESAYLVIQKVRREFHFRNAFLPAQLTARGVDLQSQLKEYPYRDDALLIWQAIHDWVQSYIGVYYGSDGDVINDAELQSWVREIEDPAMGSIQGFTPTGGMTTRAVLAETLTMIIFTASAQHAAVNFPQAEAAAVPYQPLAGYAAAPRKLGHSEQDAVDFLPPLDRAIKQTHTLTMLGNTYYTQLGEYAVGSFDNLAVVPHLLDFKKVLLKTENMINGRNRSRRTPYQHLKPSRIPQSINI